MGLTIFSYSFNIIQHFKRVEIKAIDLPVLTICVQDLLLYYLFIIIQREIAFNSTCTYCDQGLSVRFYKHFAVTLRYTFIFKIKLSFVPFLHNSVWKYEGEHNKITIEFTRAFLGSTIKL